MHKLLNLYFPDTKKPNFQSKYGEQYHLAACYKMKPYLDAACKQSPK